MENQLCILNNNELFMIDGGTFWGVVGGAATVVGGVASVVGGAALLAVPEPTMVTKAAGYGAIVLGVSSIAGGAATIANNI